LRILVVEADADSRSMYVAAFTMAGWHVVEAADGRDALVSALSHPPSLVVTELRLPFIDGFALCDILRRDRTTAAVPVLVVTTETRDEELTRARDAGAAAILIKPALPDAIVREAERLLAQPPPVVESVVCHTAVVTPRRVPLARAHPRLLTTTPSEPAPDLMCPMCGHVLHYEQTYFGGVSSRHPERWDYYSCFSCGQFQYRHRTRKLRKL
jgi:two-component system chemotaxis response regulator CheY